MRYRFFIVLPLFFIMIACNGGKKIALTATDPVKSYSGSNEYTVVYNLLRTSLEFTVETTRILTRRGPYYQFAEKYLGISGVPAQDTEQWFISGVSLNSREEADPDRYFVLTAENIHSFSYLRLVREGFIIPIYRTNHNQFFSGLAAEPDYAEDLNFTDLGVKRIVTQETQSSFRLIQQDTAFVSVPVLRKEVVRKSLEEKAKEAADFIIDLRMNRFKLISGEYDMFPDGQSMQSVLEEFKRLEEEYLSLFIGKTYKQVRTRMFEYIPSQNEEIDRTVLFRFSDSKGILPFGDLSGRPISLEISRENRTAALSSFPEPVKGDEMQGRVFYRVPDFGVVQLIDGRNVIMKNRIPVSQFGKTISIPANFRWD
jgi:hypothetical protein